MKTKYPIILVHGFFGKSTPKFHLFGKIESKLKKAGFNVFMSHIDAVGSCETNAVQLKDEILKILKETKSSKINVIAHSKGGLDARLCLTLPEMSGKVASLTTLSTPHRGSIIATKIMKLPNFLLKFVALFINFHFKLRGDKLPNVIKGTNDLTINETKLFNKEFINEKDVYYQSYSSTLKRAKDDKKIKLVKLYFDSVSDDRNDGLVSNKSSKWGEYKGDVIKGGSFSHNDICTVGEDKSKHKIIYKFYIDVCDELSKKGF